MLDFLMASYLQVELQGHIEIKKKEICSLIIDWKMFTCAVCIWTVP